MKPENVLVQDGHCFVMDFGIARKLRSEALEWAGVRGELDFSAGTPAYVSPEQARGDRDVDQRSDVYSLACVAFEMLSGRTPFGGTTTEEIVSRRFHEPPPRLRDLAPDVSPQTAFVLERAMSLDPTLRPDSAREFADELRAGLEARHLPRVILSEAKDRSRAKAVELPRGRAILRSPFAALRLPQDDSQTRRPIPKVSMSGLSSDLRYAVRSLRRGWRFALGVVLTLGLGVGLGVPVLSLADHYFLRPPPGVADPDHTVRLIARTPGRNGPFHTDGLTGLDYAVMSSRAQTLDGVAAWITTGLSMGRGPEARTISATLATASFFPVLGVRPYVGRFYAESEDVEGSTAAPCVVSYRFWQTAMNGVADAIGRLVLRRDGALYRGGNCVEGIQRARTRRGRHVAAVARRESGLQWD